MMSHRKSHSYSESVGSVPFSWEEKPGISKFSPGHQSWGKKKGELSTNTFIQLPLQKSASSYFHSPLTMMVSYSYDMKISLPPRMAQPPSPSPSMRRLWGRRQADPFAAAIKQCTKSTIKSHGDPIGSKNKDRDQNMIFSCKRSCEVKESNLVRLVDLPPLPRGRNNKGHPRSGVHT